MVGQPHELYRERYGGEDVTPVDTGEFAAPQGYFVVGYRGGEAVACGGWRGRDGRTDPELRDDDAEIKRMYVVDGHRGRGYARAVLAELERTAAAAGRRRIVLETGTLQPEAIGLYRSAGYEPMPRFGVYRCEPNSRCFTKPLTAAVAGAVSHVPAFSEPLEAALDQPAIAVAPEGSERGPAVPEVVAGMVEVP